MPLQTGQILNNRYRIVRKIAEGGFGAIYRGYDITLKRPCALKENFDTSPQAQKQFEREAVMLANLSHPNLPRVTDHFAISGQGQYLVMDYVEGEDLQEMLDRAGSSLPESQALPWIEQVCDALEYLHSQKPPIIHRDIKPANIKITSDGKAILVDFGIAKIYDPRLKTTQGARAVTPGFSPPEQYGAGTTDARSDVYALGATLYAFLTGQQPPASTDRAAGLAFLSPPRQLNSGIVLHVEAAILKAMELSQVDRFQTVTAFRNALVRRTPTLAIKPVWGVVALGLGIIGIALGIRFIKDGVQPTSSGIVSPTWTEVTSPSNTPAPPTISGVEATVTIQSLHETQTAIAALDAITPTSTATPTLGIDNTRVAPGDGMVMVYVPEGEFLMGLTDSQIDYVQAHSDDCDNVLDVSKPQHTVFLDDYWIYKTEVSNEMYQRCVAAGNCAQPRAFRSKTRNDYYLNPDYSQYPVVFVDWGDANSYCQWAGGRLPTEAEWEKAARGTDGRLFPWGNELPNAQLANIDQYFGDTTPVYSFSEGESPYGVLNMAGNVYEWVADWYLSDYYLASPHDNPPGPNNVSGELNKRVVRGGNWGWDTGCACIAVHDWWEDYQTDSGVGFRCAMDAD